MRCGKWGNEVKYYLTTAMYATMQATINGAVMQSYMLKSGVSAVRVSAFLSVLQLAQVLVYLLGSRAADRINNVIRFYGIAELLCAPFFAVMMFLGMESWFPADIKYAVMLVMGFVTNLLAGMHSVLAYKMLYHIIDLNRCGTVTAYGGIATSIFGLAHSGLLTFFLGRGEYFRVMTLFWGVGIGFMVLSGMITLSLKKVNDTKSAMPGHRTGEKINMLRYRPFCLLILPNLLRGFSAGLFGIVPVIGSEYGILGGQGAGYLVVVMNIAAYLGSFVYAKFCTHHRRAGANLLLGSSIIMAVFLPMMLAGRALWVFLAAYGIAYVAFQIIGIAVPMLLMEVVDYDVMGQYSGWRMLLHMLASMVAVSVSTFLLEMFGGTVLLAAAGLMQLVSGTAYYIVTEGKGRYAVRE